MPMSFSKDDVGLTDSQVAKQSKAKQEAARQMQQQQETQEGEQNAAAMQGGASLLGGIIGAIAAGVASGGMGAPAGFAVGSSIGSAVGGLGGEAVKAGGPTAAGVLSNTAKLGTGIASAATQSGKDESKDGLKRIGNSGAFQNKEGVVVF